MFVCSINHYSNHSEDIALPATSNVWPVLHTMPQESSCIPANIRFTHEEFQAIRRGFVPESMEDKWFAYVEGDHIHIHRSWTGYQVYDCLFEENEEGVTITGVYANRDPSQMGTNHPSNTDEGFLKDAEDTIRFLFFYLKNYKG